MINIIPKGYLASSPGLPSREATLGNHPHQRPRRSHQGRAAHSNPFQKPSALQPALEAFADGVSARLGSIDTQNRSHIRFFVAS
jgi:hypothetical protein